MPRLLAGQTISEKLLLNHVVTDSGCWRWTGAHTPKGYGQIRVNGKACAVHRAAYQIWIGAIPDGFEIDHVLERGCLNRDCINPSHLEAVEHRENLYRGTSPSAIGRSKTHCINGHEFDRQNTRYSKGHRLCRKCRRARHREYMRKRRQREQAAKIDG